MCNVYTVLPAYLIALFGRDTVMTLSVTLCLLFSIVQAVVQVYTTVYCCFIIEGAFSDVIPVSIVPFCLWRLNFPPRDR